MRLRMLIAFGAILALLVPVSAGQVGTHVPLPADLQGELDGVPYVIRVPANWNGTLLVYSYAYDLSDPVHMPLAPVPAVADTLLARGFALAVAHSPGGRPMPRLFAEAGYNMKERMQNTAALTAAFRDIVGQPKWTIAWGPSMGGLVSLALIEKFPGLFDGAVPLCAPDAGAPRMFDHKLDIIVAYAAVFGWNALWGTPGNLRQGLNVMAEVLPTVYQQLVPMTPDKLWRWEFLRRVSRIPFDSTFYEPGPGQLYPYAFVELLLTFVPLLDVNQRAGGHVAENIGRVYSLEDDDRSYLENVLGVPPAELDAKLQQMNDQAIYTSDPNARSYVEHYYNPTGRITRPVLTLHTTGDAVAIPNNEDAYRKTVEAQGRGELLMQQFSTGNGTANTHCTFTPAQMIAGIDAMMYWLENRNRPPASFFPAALGFYPGYVPNRWPW